MIAEVAFDAPVDHPFSYRVPDGWPLRAGQRVWAPLAGAKRLGMIVAVRDDDAAGLKPLLAAGDPVPVLDAAGLDLVHWIAAESLSSVGSTSAALLPPVLDVAPPRRRAGARGGDADSTGPVEAPRRPLARPTSPAPAGGASGVELLIGAGRERRLLERLGPAPGALVIVPDVEAAARWAQRLARGREVVRLDSGVEDAERARAWPRLRDGVLAVGT